MAAKSAAFEPGGRSRAGRILLQPSLHLGSPNFSPHLFRCASSSDKPICNAFWGRCIPLDFGHQVLGATRASLEKIHPQVGGKSRPSPLRNDNSAQKTPKYGRPRAFRPGRRPAGSASRPRCHLTRFPGRFMNRPYGFGGTRLRRPSGRLARIHGIPGSAIADFVAWPPSADSSPRSSLPRPPRHTSTWTTGYQYHFRSSQTLSSPPNTPGVELQGPTRSSCDEERPPDLDLHGRIRRRSARPTFRQILARRFAGRHPARRVPIHACWYWRIPSHRLAPTRPDRIGERNRAPANRPCRSGPHPRRADLA